MTNVFVSYARSDREAVDTLVQTLEALGHAPFYDDALSAGVNWWRALLDKITVSQGFIPVLSSEYLQSEACHREAEWAIALGIPMLPIDIEGVRAELCAREIANANWVKYSTNDPLAVARLARGVTELPSFTLPDPLPERPEIPISYFADLERQIRTAREIPFDQELSLVATLRAKLNTPREAATARELLIALSNRPDITYTSRVAIDALLETAPSQASQPSSSQQTVTQEPLQPKPERPKRVKPEPQPKPPPQPKSERPRRSSLSRRQAWALSAWLVLTGLLAWADTKAIWLLWHHEDHYHSYSYSRLRFETSSKLVTAYQGCYWALGCLTVLLTLWLILRPAQWVGVFAVIGAAGLAIGAPVGYARVHSRFPKFHATWGYYLQIGCGLGFVALTALLLAPVWRGWRSRS